MSAKQAVTAICRALSVYFLAWLLTDLTYVPTDVHALLHYTRAESALGASYLRDYHLITLVFLLLRIAILFIAVQRFYRAGPRLQQYFLADSDRE
jgi:hypothetical protein